MFLIILCAVIGFSKGNDGEDCRSSPRIKIEISNKNFEEAGCSSEYGVNSTYPVKRFSTGNKERDSSNSNSYLQVKDENSSQSSEESKKGFLDDSSGKCPTRRVKVEITKDEFEKDSEYATNSTSLAKRTGKGPLRRKIRIGRRNNLAELQQSVTEEKSTEGDFENKPGDISYFIMRDKLCRLCRVKFRIVRHYEQHFKDVHPYSNPYVCPSCPLETGKRCTFVNHITSKHTQTVILSRKSEANQVFNCETCRTEHLGVKQFQIHISSHHNGMKMIKCGLCDSRFAWFSSLSAHEMKVHGMHDAELQCKFCRSTFFRSDILEKHVGKCMELNAKKKTGDIRAARNNQKHHRVCYQCSEKFKSIPRLKEHFQSVHPELNGLVVCKLCQKQFRSLRNLEKHSYKFHEIEPETIRSRRNQKFTCQYCGEEIRGLCKFEAHGRKDHGKGHKSFQCVECGDGFTRKQYLERHIMHIHLGSGITCNFCENTFSTAHQTKVHEKVCGGKIGQQDAVQKEYVCGICKKIIRGTSYTWRSHRNGHKHYEYCKYCGLRFHRQRNPAGLADHILKRHRNQLDNDVKAPVVDTKE